ncbi:hypothetical protein RRG08_026663 [Elysia crispata]|uniref:Uncharacterized protein n=1 Tax=Elysia crispata TaxID=231223 RepID=A0AAE1E847_9GAST|nr:hypothetical protein RRG08_026663 [Elysia crispata]
MVWRYGMISVGVVWRYVMMSVGVVWRYAVGQAHAAQDLLLHSSQKHLQYKPRPSFVKEDKPEGTQLVKHRAVLARC